MKWLLLVRYILVLDNNLLIAFELVLSIELPYKLIYIYSLLLI
jgi:hypothetical protein